MTARIRTLLPKKYSPLVSFPNAGWGAGRKTSSIGVEVGEYDAKALVSGASSIWGVLRRMPATRNDMAERLQAHQALG
jgi:hypothetical protein